MKQLSERQKLAIRRQLTHEQTAIWLRAIMVQVELFGLVAEVKHLADEPSRAADFGQFLDATLDARSKINTIAALAYAIDRADRTLESHWRESLNDTVSDLDTAIVSSMQALAKALAGSEMESRAEEMVSCQPEFSDGLVDVCLAEVLQ